MRVVRINAINVFTFKQMDLKHIHTSEDLVKIGMNLKDYYPSGEWDILDVPAERHARIYECCPDEFYAGELIVFFFSL